MADASGWQRTEVAVSQQACPEPVSQAEQHSLPPRVVAHRHALPVRVCYDRVLAGNPQAEGKVVVSWTIQRDGSIASPIVVASEFGDDDFRACIGRAFAKLPCFPRPGDDTVSVRYPIVFAPG